MGLLGQSLPVCRGKIPKSNLSNLATERMKNAVCWFISVHFSDVILFLLGLDRVVLPDVRELAIAAAEEGDH